MIAAGPPPKRPPHMLLLSGESAIRRVPNSKIAILALLLAGSVAGCDREKHHAETAGAPQANISGGEAACGAPTDRQSLVKGKSVAVRVEIGGRMINKKKT